MRNLAQSYDIGFGFHDCARAVAIADSRGLDLLDAAGCLEASRELVYVKTDRAVRDLRRGREIAKLWRQRQAARIGQAVEP